jgi:hypothetical protein
MWYNLHVRKALLAVLALHCACGTVGMTGNEQKLREPASLSRQTARGFGQWGKDSWASIIFVRLGARSFSSILPSRFDLTLPGPVGGSVRGNGLGNAIVAIWDTKWALLDAVTGLDPLTHASSNGMVHVGSCLGRERKLDRW